MRKVTRFESEEVARVESLLDSGAPTPRTVALAVLAFALLVVTKTAGASVAPLAAPVPAPLLDSCTKHLKDVQFSGTFKLKSAASEAKPMRFVIGVPEDATPGSAVAQIWSGDSCKATCSSIDFEKGGASLPISLDLQCHGAELGALSTHVAVLWDHGPTPTTQLRFGTWLDGYEQAAVRVQVDRFNPTFVATRGDLNMPAPGKRKALAFRAPGY